MKVKFETLKPASEFIILSDDTDSWVHTVYIKLCQTFTVNSDMSVTDGREWNGSCLPTGSLVNAIRKGTAMFASIPLDEEVMEVE